MTLTTLKRVLAASLLAATLTPAMADAPVEHPVIKRPYKLAPSADLVYSIKAKQRGIALSGESVSNWRAGDGKVITFSATTATVPWQEGAQDKASVPFQLAAIGRADVNQLAGNIDILVGEEKEATVFRFQLVGEEELETKMGRLVTWHLRRPPKPGTYSSQLDIWLAPSMQWYPVQIRNTEANGALTTQTVTRISVNAAPTSQENK